MSIHILDIVNLMLCMYRTSITFVIVCWANPRVRHVKRAYVFFFELWSSQPHIYSINSKFILEPQAIVRAALEFRNLVATSTLEPEFQGKGKARKPLCSTPYKYMFNTCRIPRSGKDVFYMYPSDSAGCNSILVIRKNRFYICDVADRDGKLISASQLEHQLETIKKMAESSQGST